MEARLTGPPPEADSEREKNFQKGTHTKESVIKPLRQLIYRILDTNYLVLTSKQDLSASVMIDQLYDFTLKTSSF